MIPPVKARKLATPAKEADLFETTHWSVVLQAAPGGSDERTHDALAQLCRIYWRPIFAFICHRGYPVTDAQDLTQDFFVTLLKGNLLRLADPSRGRFRSLLFKSIQNFLIDAQARRKTLKRGAGVDFVSFDERMAEAPSHLAIPLRTLEALSPECAFDLRWAATVVERALQQLREECDACGRRRAFDLIGHHLTGSGEEISYADLAQKLGLPLPAVKRLIYQMRQRFRGLLRHEVAQTVESPEEIEAEIRYLCTALAAARE